MSDEPFIDATALFQAAFAASDPVPPLLRLLKEHPTYYAVQELVIDYLEELETHPSRGQHLASALGRLQRSPHAPPFGDTTLSMLIDDELGTHHFKATYADARWENPEEFGPTNVYLVESFISGLSLKHGLTMTGDQLTPIRDALDWHSKRQSMKGENMEKEMPEVVLVGACIQIMLGAGATIISEGAGSYRQDIAQVVKKLRMHKQLGMAKHPNASRLLEMTIRHAETGFKPENDIDNPLAILFSSEVDQA